MKRLIILLLSIFPVAFWQEDALAYEASVHRKISNAAYTSSDLSSAHIRNFVLSPKEKLQGLTILEWIMQGSDLEDNLLRPLNHFYDPTTGQGLFNGKSSLQWAKDYADNEWEWNWAKYSYYSALINSRPSERSAAFAHLFRGSGQIIHLIQDKSVPAHTRNDAHLPYSILTRDMYEKYTRAAVEEEDSPNPQIPHLSYTGYPPVELSVFSNLDTFWINGGKGLAEYTNMNFLSRHTNIDDARYALPAPIGEWTTKETIIDPYMGQMEFDVKYVQGYATDNYRPGESRPISRLSAYSYMDFEMQKYGYSQRVYALNNRIHKEYADLLIPRAVGYSAGFLNYFFRGTIDISVPTNGLYSLINSTDSGFIAIKLKATNTTTTGEDMTGGTIHLVVKYKVAHADPFQPGPVERDSNFSYIVVPEQNSVSALYSATPTELNFDLTQTPIPLWSTDVYLQVVFKGMLGTEVDAVGVGFKDIGEPTPLDIFHSMDKICINGSWYDAGSEQAIQQVDTNHNGIADYPNEADVYAHNPKNLYILFSPYSETTARWAYPTVYDITVSDIGAGNHVRPIYVLSDYQFDDTTYIHFERVDSSDYWAHNDKRYWFINHSIRRQTDYVEDSGLCGGLPSCELDYYPGEAVTFPADETPVFYTFRGARVWLGCTKIFIVTSYPPGSQCSYDSL